MSDYLSHKQKQVECASNKMRFETGASGRDSYRRHKGNKDFSSPVRNQEPFVTFVSFR